MISRILENRRFFVTRRGLGAKMGNVSLEEPRALVQQLVSKFLPESDISTLQNVSLSFNQLLAARQKKMAQSRETLQRKTVAQDALLLTL